LDPTLVNKTIEALAVKLGPLGQRLWEVYIRQCIIDGVIGTAVSWAFMAFILLYATNRLLKFEDLTDNDKAFFAILLCIFALAAFVLGLSYLRYLINPEYFAVQRLLNQAIP